ncbi:MAG: tRNA pseudouridine(55) synthase TruB [Candidatus Berkiella sp.]
MMIDGILLLNKPTGISSNSALQKTKRLLKADKAGHTGCLDPLASGMLPICLGEATKFSRFFIEEDKRYTVEACLGSTTTTGDKEGEVLNTQAVPSFSDEQIQAALSHFLGTQTQIPPMYSAVKHNGQPLYKLARRGIEVARKERTITISELTLTHRDQDRLVLTVTCSKGTYIRTLVEGLGQFLGCGAHVGVLHRLWVAPFQSYPMVELNELAGADNTAMPFLLSVPEILAKLLPAVTLDQETAIKLCRGQTMPFVAEQPQENVILLDHSGDFMGIGQIADNRIAPKRLMAKTSENNGCASIEPVLKCLTS